MDTISCLLRYPWRTLTALAAVYDVPAHHRHPKEQVARELSDVIHACLSQTLAILNPDARAALRSLAQADALTFPQPDFVARFGLLHPYRPWAPHVPPAPWPTPPSPAATIVHYGLAYPLNLGTRQRPLHAVILPHDLHMRISESTNQRINGSARQRINESARPLIGASAHLHNLDVDLFTFLSYLNRQDHPVRHGRWLSPRALQALNQYLSPPDDLGSGRSELQAARIPFIHYLAERAGLVGLIGDCLKPTLTAQEWLAAPRPRRLRILWDAWREPCDDNHALWSRYRLPALQEDDDLLARFHALLESLAACPIGPLGYPTGLIETLAYHNPALLRPQATYAAWAALDPDERAGFETRARAVLLDLLTGPLLWFGVLESASQRISASAAPAFLHLTPPGAALLGRDDGEWPTDPAPTPLRLAPILDQGTGRPARLRPLGRQPGSPHSARLGAGPPLERGPSSVPARYC